MPDKNTGRDIAHKLLKKKLAVCCNISSNVTSIYTWQNEVHEDNECVLFVKTTKLTDTMHEIEHIHPYDVPAIIALDILAINDKYKSLLSRTCAKD